MGARFGLGLIAVVVVAVLVGVLAANSQGSTVAAPPSTSVPAQTVSPPPGWVYMEHQSGGSSFFNPPTLTVSVNQPVTFRNVDSEDHNALADNNSFNTGVLSPGQSKTWVPKKAGTYSYGDFLHPEMHGVLVVQ